jgi:hypothetical protein
MWYLWSKSGTGAGPPTSTSPFLASTTPPIFHTHLIIYHQASNHEIPIQTFGVHPSKTQPIYKYILLGKRGKFNVEAGSADIQHRCLKCWKYSKVSETQRNVLSLRNYLSSAMSKQMKLLYKRKKKKK